VQITYDDVHEEFDLPSRRMATKSAQMSERP